MLHLETITPDNWRISLEVNEHQKSYVSKSSEILARAYAYRNYNSKVFIIYNDNIPIGMAMYYDLLKLNAYNLSQFFIDKNYQGKGMGEKALNLIIEKIRENKKFDKIILCYIKDDFPAKNLYEKIGFKHNGQIDGDEICMELKL